MAWLKLLCIKTLPFGVTYSNGFLTHQRKKDPYDDIEKFMLQDEIEVAMRHSGTGYVALGWRPSSGIDGTCRAEAPGNFPLGMMDLL